MADLTRATFGELQAEFAQLADAVATASARRLVIFQEMSRRQALAEAKARGLTPDDLTALREKRK